jgi:hypothetical protein
LDEFPIQPEVEPRREIFQYNVDLEEGPFRTGEYIYKSEGFSWNAKWQRAEVIYFRTIRYVYNAVVDVFPDGSYVLLNTYPDSLEGELVATTVSNSPWESIRGDQVPGDIWDEYYPDQIADKRDFDPEFNGVSLGELVDPVTKAADAITATESEFDDDVSRFKGRFDVQDLIDEIASSQDLTKEEAAEMTSFLVNIDAYLFGQGRGLGSPSDPYNIYSSTLGGSVVADVFIGKVMTVEELNTMAGATVASGNPNDRVIVSGIKWSDAYSNHIERDTATVTWKWYK